MYLQYYVMLQIQAIILGIVPAAVNMPIRSLRPQVSALISPLLRNSFNLNPAPHVSVLLIHPSISTRCVCLTKTAKPTCLINVPHPPRCHFSISLALIPSKSKVPFPNPRYRNAIRPGLAHGVSPVGLWLFHVVTFR